MPSGYILAHYGMWASMDPEGIYGSRKGNRGDGRGRANAPRSSSVSPPPLVCWFPLAAERGAISPIQLRDEWRRRGTPVASVRRPKVDGATA
jgi:hypothetical protein